MFASSYDRVENIEIKSAVLKNRYAQMPRVTLIWYIACDCSYITNIYNEEDDNNTWFNKIKEFVGKYNFASEVKEYKKNPDSYIGHVGDFCEMLRVAVTTLSNTPNLYDILSILGKEEIEKRIKMFEVK